VSDAAAAVSRRSLALRFGVLLPLLGGGLMAAAAYAQPLQPLRARLVHATAVSAGVLLPLTGWDVTRDGHALKAPGDRAVEVVKDCDGLSAMLLFLAAVLVTPATWKRKLVFGGIGLAALFLVNQVRIGHLLHLSGGNQQTFRSAHETWWPAALVLVAAALFLLWAGKQASRA